jgi:elongator complex protein 1
MRNLRNLRFGQCQRANVTATCWDPEKDQVLCVAGPTEESSGIELLRVTGDQDM